MSIPYEQVGRIRQKQRTRNALIAAARELVAAGRTPTVEAAAAAAGISRSTAFRYFPNQRSLIVAAHPETEASSLGSDNLVGTLPSRGSVAVSPAGKRVYYLNSDARQLDAFGADRLVKVGSRGIEAPGSHLTDLGGTALAFRTEREVVVVPLEEIK